jgi:hypothetical protein
MSYVDKIARLQRYYESFNVGTLQRCKQHYIDEIQYMLDEYGSLIDKEAVLVNMADRLTAIQQAIESKCRND